MGEVSQDTAGKTASEVAKPWWAGLTVSQIEQEDDARSGWARVATKGDFAELRNDLRKGFADAREDSRKAIAETRHWMIATCLGMCLGFTGLILALVAGVGQPPRVQAPLAAQPTVIVLPAPAAK